MRTVVLILRAALRRLTRAKMLSCILIVFLASTSCAAGCLLFGITSILRPSGPYLHPETLWAPTRVTHSGTTLHDIPAVILSVWNHQSYIDSLFAYEISSGAARRAPDGTAESVTTVYVSPGFNETLKVPPKFGLPLDSANHNAATVLLSASAWRLLFPGATTFARHELIVNGTALSVTGVMRDDFAFPLDVRGPTLWISAPELLRDQAKGFQVVIRGRIGLSGADLQSMLTATSRPELGSQPIRVERYTEHFSTLLGSFLIVLTILLILIGISASLLTATMFYIRNLSLDGYRATLFSLGSPRWRIVVNDLSESLVLTCVSAMSALLLAPLLYRRLVALALSDIPFLPVSFSAISLESYVLGASGLAASAYVALQVVSSLRPGAKDRPGVCLPAWRMRLTRVGVMFSLALSFSFLDLSSAIRTDQEVAMRKETAAAITGVYAARLNDADLSLGDKHPFTPYLRALETLSEAPHIRQAALATSFPLVGGSKVEYSLTRGDVTTTAMIRAVSAGFLELEGTSLSSGRYCSSADEVGSSMTALVNQQFADLYSKGAPIIGQNVELGDSMQARVIGVFGGGAQGKFQIGRAPEIVLCLNPFLAQSPLPSRIYAGEMVAVFRPTLLPPDERALRRALQKGDPGISVRGIQKLIEAVDNSYSLRRFLSVLIEAVTTGAFGMAFLGIYALVEFQLESRSADMSIKLALGAPLPALIRSVLVDLLRLCAISFFLGAGMTLLISRLLSSIFPMFHNAAIGFTTPILLIIAILSTIFTRAAFKVSHLPLAQLLNAGAIDGRSRGV